MKKFFTILFFVFLLFIIALSAVYVIYINDVYRKVHDTLEMKLSETTGTTVTIGDIKLLPPRTIFVSSVIFSKKDVPEEVLASAKNTTIAISLPSLIKNKQLETMISLRGLKINGVEVNAVLKTISPKADTYEEAFDTSRIDSVFIIDAMASSDGFILQDIVGNVEFTNGHIDGGKLIFVTDNYKYFTSFTMPENTENPYNVEVRSENINLSSAFTMAADRIVLESLTGTYYTVHLDINGEIINPFTEQIALSFGGTWELDLRSLATLQGSIGNFCRNTLIAGQVRSNVFFSGSGPDINDYKLSSTIHASKVRLDKLRVTEFMTKISLNNDLLEAPLLNGTFYDGTLNGHFSANVFEKGMPFTLRLIINNLDFEKMMKDLTSEKSKVYGILGFNLDLDGLIENPASWSGHGDLTISNGDLGPMPLITPLLGDMYAYLQRFLPSSGQDKITDAYVDFDIHDRKIFTEDLTLLGREIAINAAGSVDFEGNLDFVFENEIMPRNPEEKREWHEKVRDSIINLGKHIKRTKLSGTLKEPEWGI